MILGNDKGSGRRDRIRQTRKWLLLGTSAALILGTGSPLVAQTGGTTEAAGSTPIVVTATRREANLQDVPIAITAFSQDDLREVGADQLQDLIRVVPNATLYDDRGAGQPTWVIRGVALADFNPNNTPTAAIFYDEFYLPSNALSGLALYDVDRVEILKGPQGGLYGRNTTGGAVRLISRQPDTSEFGGYIDASYGSWGRIQAQGALNVPLSDSLAIRISARTDQDGGWQDSLATPGDDNHGDRDIFSLRGQILFEPSDFVRLRVKIETGSDNSETLLGRATASEDLAVPFAFCAPVIAGRQNEALCGTWADRNLLAMGQPLGFSARDQSDNARVVLSNPINQLDNDWMNYNFQADFELGFATLTSITNRLTYDYRQVFDYDGSQLALGHEDSDVHFSVWSQELRLTSTTDSNFDWLIGGVYNYDRIDDSRDFALTDNVIAAPPPVNSLTRSYNQKTEAWAVYANLGYDFSDRVRLHGSLRYTDESRRIYNATLFVPALNFNLFEGYSDEINLQTHWTGHIGLDFHPSDDVLLYATATRGYKSGGFFGGVATDTSVLLPYLEETIWAYELGFKTEWPGGLRVNGAAFYYDYQDRQGYLNQVNPANNLTAVRLGNLGDVELYGAELELAWTPPEVDGLTLMANVAYLEGSITDSNATSVTLTGQPYALEGLPVSAPRWSMFALARYEFPLSAALRGALQVNYAWQASPNPDSSYTAGGSDISYALYHIPSHGTLDARISVAGDEGRWELSLEGRNLTDVSHPAVATRDSGGSYMSFYNAPRTFRARLVYNF
ncbi:TonB-dependent receptor [Parasphingopyxis marina]|uniref:TonB-dependent receptor n=1 Tax=Parasphingopyxis marina TaxID=2761622 RepID=A0A842I1B9_9SPHN|nr:TonB-dependent receptor [Parasphingopyxis marina]MBC2778945.1 TonB-dependent receptor [Parasphingopyxis marina]